MDAVLWFFGIYIVTCGLFHFFSLLNNRKPRVQREAYQVAKRRWKNSFYIYDYPRKPRTAEQQRLIADALTHTERHHQEE